MKDVRYTPSAGIPHGSMADEFLGHKRGPKWWYATGYFKDDAGNLFTFLFTLAKIKIYAATFNVLMTALADFQTEVYSHEVAIHEFFADPPSAAVSGRPDLAPDLAI